jgi:hypothetical protein
VTQLGGGGVGPQAVASAFALSSAQVRFFETFGFLVLPGLYADEVERIIDGFEDVFAHEQGLALDPANPYHRSRDPEYEQQTRWIVPSFLDRSDKLSWLRTDHRLDGIARGLLGSDYEYAESDGNLFNCDVYWHIDAYGATADTLHIKVFFYLDPLSHDAGALRVIPGSHHPGPYGGGLYRALALEPGQVIDAIGVGVDQVPSWTLEVEPGDAIVTNFKLLHGSFRGAVRRRLFTVNYRAADAETSSTSGG